MSSIKPGEEEGGILRFEMEYNCYGRREAMSEEYFDRWARGESKKYVRQRLDELDINLHLASVSGASFLTDVPSSHDMLSATFEEQEGAVTTHMALDLPYLSNISVVDLANARKNEAAFQEFRAAFDEAMAQVESLEPKHREQQVDQIIHDIIQRPVAQIDKRVKSLHRNVLADSVLAVGALAATVVAGGGSALTLGALAATAKAIDSYKNVKKEKDEIEANPSFFYWEATKNARK